MCATLDQCSSDNLVYGGVTSILVQEYNTTNSAVRTRVTAFNSCLAVILTLFLPWYL